MATALTLKLIMALLLFLSMTPPRTVYGDEDEEWCIADEQTPDEELQAAMDWACGRGGADCSKIQEKQSCFMPNTVRSHASFAFNSYFQKFKHSGGSCYFRGAAIITQQDPNLTLLPDFLPLDRCTKFQTSSFSVDGNSPWPELSPFFRSSQDRLGYGSCRYDFIP